jgi:alpha-2-macroglobulin-like protein
MRNFKYTIPLIAVAILLLTGFLNHHDPGFPERLKKSLKEYLRHHPEEKVYLQFDKPLYKPGEDIWFNAFLVNANSHKPSTISDVVYVEFKDPKGNTAERLELLVNDGSTRGDFKLPETAPGGIYNIVAYTRWMQNAGEESFFKKQIQVQSVITTRLLLKLDYEKESYGNGDQVRAELSVRDLKNDGIDKASIRAEVMLNGNVIQKIEAETQKDGKGTITFGLPDMLSTSDGLLQIVVSSGGITESISRSIPIVLNKIDLNFYPEGGDLAQDVDCVVAFKAVNEFGKGADVSGKIIDDEGKEITTFESLHMGMGSFRIRPRKGRKYYAELKTPIVGSPVLLPAPVEDAYVLHVESQTKDEIELLVNSPENSEIFLVAQVRGELTYAEKKIAVKGENHYSIDISSFPAGIAMLTLFNTTGLEEAERLVFVNEQKKLRINIVPDQAVYQPGEKVNVKIITTDENGKALAAKLSLAVVDDQLISFADDKQDNILSWLFLSSELKGEIQEPSFYFNPEEKKAKMAIDLLMLTHGWRRFNWKQIFNDEGAVAFIPEKNSTISGLTRKKSENDPAEVILLELGNRRRIAKVKSNVNGQFVFKNIDPSVPLLLLTNSSHQVELVGMPNAGVTPGFSSVDDFMTKQIAVEINEGEIAQEAKFETPVAEANGMNLQLESDVTSLSEVVVVGFSDVQKSDLASSVVSVTNEALTVAGGYNSLDKILSGRVPGLVITPDNSSNASGAQIRVRGYSYQGMERSEPLYVVDGVKLKASMNQNFFNSNLVASDDIVSIQVLQPAEASSLFGSEAVNGAIIVTTNSNLAFRSIHEKPRKGRYTSLVVSPRKFSVTREFYKKQGAFRNNSPDKRSDFNTTVYWNSLIVTDEKGEASVSFIANDAVSAFKITAEGISASGLVGRNEETYSTSLPLTLDAKIPDYLGFEDTLRIEVNIKNSTAHDMRAKVFIKLPPELKTTDRLATDVTLLAKQNLTHYFTIIPANISGKFPVTISVRSDQYSDEIKQDIMVHPIGFPMRLSISARDSGKKFNFTIQDVEKGSIEGEVKAYAEVLSDLMDGAEGIFREPHGCFEQVSSSTFPNILALQYLRESGKLSRDIEKQALKYIDEGYRKLVSYEIKTGGFDWFGNPPAHEGLTGYGLIEFHEMKKVFKGVDEDMVQRTVRWLLKQRKGDGTFYQQEHALDGFSASSKSVTNIYLVYALSETGNTKQVEMEYQYALKDCWRSKDFYKLALAANCAFNMGDFAEYKKLTEHFKAETRARPLDQLQMERSIVSSYGNSLSIEGISLWAIALLKSPEPDMEQVDKCIEFVLSKRSNGMFGSTQGTTLALKALTEYARSVGNVKREGGIALTVNGRKTDSQTYTADTRQRIIMNKFSPTLKEGANQFNLAYDEGSDVLPYSIDIKWNSKTPASSRECKVRIKTSLQKSVIKVNETSRLNIALENTSNETVPMTMAVIGIPAGVSLQPWQLKELQERKVFDFYEIIDDKLALYYRKLGPGESRIVNLDLKAEVPGSFTAIASSAYLYYTDEYKNWARGASIQILP